MPTGSVLKGSIKLLKDISEVCWGTPQEFVNLLTQVLGVNFPTTDIEGFVVYGFQIPSPDAKGQLWWKTDRAGHYVGDFHFIEGKWQRVFNYTIHDVIWKSGDSRTPADGGTLDVGFQVIDGTVASIPTDVQDHIMTFYHENTAESLAFGSLVWDYYATIYVGI